MEQHTEQAPPPGGAPRHIEINLERLSQLGMVTHDGGRTAVAEDFRIIKRPLLRNARGDRDVAPLRHGNLIVITSALPGEGKTFCAVNLAMSIAMEMDITVLLVDADVARPSVLKVLGLPAEPGLMDILLRERTELSDVILKTNVATLSILPAGRANKHATELLASRSMSRLLTEIAERYADRIVIFDSPPLLMTTEASVLAAQMGQIVMVVESETTSQHAVKEALRHIEQCPHVSLIYNKSKAFPGGEYYGYYD
ncbi:XrtA-associated tyrosine autokinase [Rugamonas sp. A1-17]|nr:XrtA-associated tyrosine autokinase [Rugamonas sp. A1-17]